MNAIFLVSILLQESEKLEHKLYNLGLNEKQYTPLKKTGKLSREYIITKTQKTRNFHFEIEWKSKPNLKKKDKNREHRSLSCQASSPYSSGGEAGGKEPGRFFSLSLNARAFFYEPGRTKQSFCAGWVLSNLSCRSTKYIHGVEINLLSTPHLLRFPFVKDFEVASVHCSKANLSSLPLHVLSAKGLRAVCTNHL